MTTSGVSISGYDYYPRVRTENLVRFAKWGDLNAPLPQDQKHWLASYYRGAEQFPSSFSAMILAAWDRLFSSFAFLAPWSVQFRKHMNVGIGYLHCGQ